MEVTSISPTAGAAHTPHTPHALARAQTDAPADKPTIRRGKEPTPPPGLIGSNMLVEFSRHPGTGAETVRFVDKRTGELVNQFPAEQVLDAVTNLMTLVRRREA